MPTLGSTTTKNITNPTKTSKSGRSAPTATGNVVRESRIDPNSPDLQGVSGGGRSRPGSTAPGGLPGLGGFLTNLGGPSAGTQAGAFGTGFWGGGGGGVGGGGGGGGTNLPTTLADVQASPQSLESYEALKAYNESLASRSNPLITGAMQRSRDLTAGELQAASEAAGRAGGGGAGLEALLRSRASAAGARRTDALGEELAGRALTLEGQSRRGQADVAAGIDQWRTGQQRALTDLWTAGAGLDLARARLQQESLQNAQNQQLALAQLYLQASNPRFWSGY